LYHPCCPIDLFIGANFRSFGVCEREREREKIESFGEREENYYTTPARPALYLPLSAMNEREQVVCVCVMKMKGFAALLFLLFAQEFPILRRISFRPTRSCPTRQTRCAQFYPRAE